MNVIFLILMNYYIYSDKVKFITINRISKIKSVGYLAEDYSCINRLNRGFLEHLRERVKM